MLPRLLLAAVVGAAAAVAAAFVVGTLPPSRHAADTRPTLAVVVVVDQMRGDYLRRFGGELTGGLARLAREGAVFDSAFHDHAITQTAPGHSVILSGRFPRSTGIVSNALGVDDQRTGDPSPARFRGTTLGDWLTAADPRARTLAISPKAVAAVLMSGRERRPVLWYAPNDGFTTGRSFAAVPEWVGRWNARHLARRANGRGAALSDTITYARGTPWVDDSVTLDAALAGVRAMRLGVGPQTDLLAVSLSATDVIGHRWGPDSPQMHDQIVYLDRVLGAFLDSLIALRGRDRVVVALTADHGVAPLPEVTGNGARRVTVQPAIDSVNRWVAERGLPSRTTSYESGTLRVDRSAFVLLSVSADTAIARFARSARAIPGVLRVDRMADLARADTVHDAIARRWLHSLAPTYDAVAVVTLRPGSIWSDGSSGVLATHGSPHDYDAHVPLIFWGASFRAGHRAAPVRVVDLAPTLAQALGVRPTERVDGRVLR